MLDWGSNHSSGIVWIGERDRERREEEGREKEEKETAWILQSGINADAFAERIGERFSLKRRGVGEGVGAGSAQSSLVGVEQVETGPDK